MLRQAFARPCALPVLALLVLAVASPAQSDCEPEWKPTYGGLPGLDGSVHASLVFDDGSGPALYAAGSFTSAQGVLVENIARWNGQEWQPVGYGFDDAVDALAVFDDGTGPAL